jgi:hypothetical protein
LELDIYTLKKISTPLVPNVRRINNNIYLSPKREASEIDEVQRNVTSGSHKVRPKLNSVIESNVIHLEDKDFHSVSF